MSRPVAFFDLDGVLVDSRPGIVACARDALESLGIPAPDDARIAEIIGPPLAAGFAGLLGAAPHDPRVAACVRRYRAGYGDASIVGTTAVPGIARVLATLRERVDLAVATSKSACFALPILERLELLPFFAVVAAPTPETDGEDKTATLRRAIVMVEDRTGRALDARAAFMIGDRKYDVAAALATGMTALGATWGFGSEAELRAAGAHAIVREPEALPALIAGRAQPA